MRKTSALQALSSAANNVTTAKKKGSFLSREDTLIATLVFFRSNEHIIDNRRAFSEVLYNKLVNFKRCSRSSKVILDVYICFFVFTSVVSFTKSNAIAKES